MEAEDSWGHDEGETRGFGDMISVCDQQFMPDQRDSPLDV
jgi:hypothetical protein